jgi:hypothetical protein
MKVLLFIIRFILLYNNTVLFFIYFKTAHDKVHFPNIPKYAPGRSMKIMLNFKVFDATLD